MSVSKKGWRQHCALTPFSSNDSGCRFEQLELRLLLATVPYRGAGEADPLMPTVFGKQNESWQDIALQSDGKPVVVGELDRISRIYRFNTNGTKDASFAGTGSVAINFGTNLETLNQVVVQPDGKILVAGNYD